MCLMRITWREVLRWMRSWDWTPCTMRTWRITFLPRKRTTDGTWKEACDRKNMEKYCFLGKQYLSNPPSFEVSQKSMMDVDMEFSNSMWNACSRRRWLKDLTGEPSLDWPDLTKNCTTREWSLLAVSGHLVSVVYARPTWFIFI